MHTHYTVDKCSGIAINRYTSDYFKLNKFQI